MEPYLHFSDDFLLDFLHHFYHSLLFFVPKYFLRSYEFSKSTVLEEYQ